MSARAVHRRATIQAAAADALLCVTLMGVLAGCATDGGDSITAISTSAPAKPTDAGPRDARPTAPQLYELQIFQLSIPEGSISRNVDFWKPFDETFLGLWKHDVLYKNGLRVGRAPLTELAAIQGELDDAETSRSQLIGSKGQNVELELETGVGHEIVFAFDSQGRSEGHDFYSVDNLFMLGFRQVPRQPDHVYLDIAPAVRDQKQKLTMGTDDRIRWQQAQTIYQVGISTQLGVDECLVVAPSDVAVQTSTSVGRVFMMEERPAARVEKVLVIVPRVVGSLQELNPGPLRTR